jgi:uroporphyrinogen III methyltransferase / synthase
VVTRAGHQAGALADLLTARGATVLSIPTITIAPPVSWQAVDAALGRLDQYDWIVFTSANAVAAVWERLGRLGVALPAGLRTAAVGPATAAALAARGAAVPVLPATFQGDALAGAMPDLPGARVLLPRGDLARDATVEALEAAGAVVEALTVYRTVPAEVAAADLALLREGVDAITFTAPSTVRNFAAAMGGEVSAVMDGAVVACIGPVTAEAVRELALPEPLQPPEATSASLVAALEAHFQ